MLFCHSLDPLGLGMYLFCQRKSNKLKKDYSVEIYSLNPISLDFDMSDRTIAGRDVTIPANPHQVTKSSSAFSLK